MPYDILFEHASNWRENNPPTMGQQILRMDISRDKLHILIHDAHRWSSLSIPPFHITEGSQTPSGVNPTDRSLDHENESPNEHHRGDMHQPRTQKSHLRYFRRCLFPGNGVAGYIEVVRYWLSGEGSDHEALCGDFFGGECWGVGFWAVVDGGV